VLELTPNTWHLVEIWTDHKNLEYFMTAKKLNCHQARWSLYLARFNFKLIYCPGCSMGKPNTLSQRPDHGNRAFDNEDVVLLRPELIAVWALEGLYLEGPEQDMLREICQENQKDDQEEPVVKAARELRQASSKIVCSAKWSEDDRVLRFRGKIYVLWNLNLQRWVVSLCHDTKVARHPGHCITKGYLLVLWWTWI